MLETINNQYYILECPPEDECWDIETEGEQDTWASWRGTSIPDDCERERTERIFLLIVISHGEFLKRSFKQLW